MAAAGYPLVVLAFGYKINWKLMYFKQIASACWHCVTPLWATAAIRASSVGSTIYYAVGTQGKHFLLAYGHVTRPQAQTPIVRQEIPLRRRGAR
ncbi:MAG: hypothetical protein RIS47_667 [Bacteroidota bacterium]|jgi:hypothetical protein